MKTESTAKYILRLSLILFVIAGVVALALAGVNSITAPAIEKLNAETYKTVKTTVQTPSIKQISTLDDGTSMVAFYDAVGAQDYAIYRATSQKGTYTNVTSQCQWYYDEESGLNMFVAPTPTDGKTYYFKVRGIYYGSKKTYYSSYSSIKKVVA